jgi:predicted permease
MFSWLGEQWRRLRFWWRRAELEKELADEMALHQDLSGACPGKFGNSTVIAEDSRAYWGWAWLDTVGQDLNYALRIMRNSPLFTSVAVLSLALGIGANTAIFTLMESVLWKPIPATNPEQLRLMSWESGPNTVSTSSWGNMSSTPSGGRSSTSFPYAAFVDLQRQNTHFEAICAFKPLGRLSAVIDGRPELVRVQLVSGNYFGTLGVSAAAGRSIAPEDDLRAKNAVGMISYGFWTRRFGRDSGVIGRSIVINQIPVTVIGVAQRGFTGTQSGAEFDVFLPVTAQPVVLPWRYARTGDLLAEPDYWWLLIMGRLRPGVNEKAAESALDVVLQQSVAAHLPDRVKQDRPRLRLLTGSRGLDDLRSSFRTPLYVLGALVALVLLVACVNLASLLLARATARQREISVRLALGAGRWRIRRQMLTEGLTLSLLGGTAGIVLGYWMRDLIPALFGKSWDANPIPADFDLRVLLLSLGVTLLTGVLFSLAPAWQATRGNVSAGLKEGGGKTLSRSKLSAGKVLVSIQIALSVLLLVGAGLFVRTLAKLKATDLGFRAENILLFDVDPPRTRYSGETRKAFFESLEERVASIPMIDSVSLSTNALLAGSTNTTRVVPEGRKPTDLLGERAWVMEVGHAFFETMGIPILYGRDLSQRDHAKAPQVAVVNQQFAKQFFPSDVPVGKTFRHGNRTVEIVGICADALYDRIRNGVPPTFYFPYTQAPDVGSMTFEVRTTSDPEHVVRAIRSLVEQVDKDVAIFDIRTQRQQIDATISRERVFATLATAFGVLALTLACIGIYGVMAHGVARRTSEIGIRMALGAQRRQVLQIILRETVLLTIIGVVLGIAGAAALTRYVRAMLYGLEPFDPVTFCTAIFVMVLVALFAGWWPARTASRIDPITALRHE